MTYDPKHSGNYTFKHELAIQQEAEKRPVGTSLERWLIQHYPRIGKHARRFYNKGN